MLACTRQRLSPNSGCRETHRWLWGQVQDEARTRQLLSGWGRAEQRGGRRVSLFDVSRLFYSFSKQHRSLGNGTRFVCYMSQTPHRLGFEPGCPRCPCAPTCPLLTAVTLPITCACFVISQLEVFSSSVTSVAWTGAPLLQLRVRSLLPATRWKGVSFRSPRLTVRWDDGW